MFGSSNPATAAKIRTELTRHTAYMQKYIKDNNDGLYVLHPDFELLKIDAFVNVGDVYIGTGVR